MVPGRPSRMAPARRPAQVDGPTDSVTRVHSGIAWGCGGPCLAPPAGAVRLTAKTGLPTPGLSLAIGRYCLSESLRPTVVSRRKPGGPRPMRGQRSLPPHGVFSDLPCRADVVPGPYRGAGRHAGSAATPAVRAHHEGRVSLGANSAFALVTLISIVLAALQLAGVETGQRAAHPLAAVVKPGRLLGPCGPLRELRVQGLATTATGESTVTAAGSGSNGDDCRWTSAGAGWFTTAKSSRAPNH